LPPYARAAEAMRELSGCAMSAGALSAAARRCAAGLVGTGLKIKRGLRRSPVIHADETGLRVEGEARLRARGEQRPADALRGGRAAR
jgi:hypothetical protein